MVSQRHRNLVQDLISNNGTVVVNLTAAARTTGVRGIVNSGESIADHHNSYDAPDTTRGDGYDTMTVVFFVLFMIISICIIMVKISLNYHQRGNMGQQRQEDNQHHHHSLKPGVVRRSQEDIEHRLVMKKVMSIGETNHIDLEKGQQQKAKITKMIDRRKSNIILYGDELDESRSCPICLCDYQSGESICWSHNKQCFHRFHAACGVAWLATHSECPVCRADYLVPPSEEENELKKDSESCGASSDRAQNPITIIDEDEAVQEEITVGNDSNNITTEMSESVHDVEDAA